MTAELNNAEDNASKINPALFAEIEKDPADFNAILQYGNADLKALEKTTKELVDIQGLAQELAPRRKKLSDIFKKKSTKAEKAEKATALIARIDQIQDSFRQAAASCDVLLLNGAEVLRRYDAVYIPQAADKEITGKRKENFATHLRILQGSKATVEIVQQTSARIKASLTDLLAPKK